MSRRLGDWGLPGVIADLLRVAHHDHGVRSVQLLEQQVELMRHPAVAQRVADGLDVRRAVVKAVDDVGVFGGGAASGVVWTVAENEAVRALLFAANSVAVGGAERVLHPLAKQRAEVASELVGATNERQFRRPRDARGARAGGMCSDETELLTRFVLALDALDVPLSHTRGLARTPPLPSSPEPEVGVADLLGTWRGTTESAWLLKDRDATGAGSAPCYMVVRTGCGSPRVSWLYRSGVSVAVSVRIAMTPEGRRMLCVYESDLAHTIESQTPSHRGACILDIDRAGAAVPPSSVISGHYWSDRQTQGMLRFHERAAAADDFAGAAELFGDEKLSAGQPS